MWNLARRRVLITGAAGGLGRALSRAFARAGAEVILTDREEALVLAAAEELRADGGQALGIQMNVTDIDSVRRAHERLLAERGPIDVLVNNAGVVFGGPLCDVPWARHLVTYQVNLIGVTATTYVFLPDLIAKSAGHVVNVASAAGIIPLPNAATYAASKWGVIGFSESLREELRIAGNGHVGVTTVCPGYIQTGLFAGASTPRFLPMLTPERVASLTLHAVQTNRELVLTPFFVKLAPILKELLPRSWSRRFADWIGLSSSMTGWRGRAEDIPSSPPVDSSRAASRPTPVSSFESRN